MDRVQHHVWDKLCEMSGEEVARALTNYHGDQLLNEGFYRYLLDDGYIEDDLGLCSPDNEDDED